MQTLPDCLRATYKLLGDGDIVEKRVARKCLLYMVILDQRLAVNPAVEALVESIAAG